ncbi:MAG: undecaprenyldiphospho-muramoylpentapeptide beta-N-acetylglucosaminyltransferase [Bacteroidales bacterium]|nr:undecaprenyldiphospho-muramoylpentapeptide beta-N-acetylglucosaminyltransferase [Bacteroidales bacterium]
MKAIRAIISGGGTGGHIFPALAIAGELKRRNPDTEILFVGANGRMEMEKVPAAGYRIEGLDIQGFNRKNPLKNILLPLKLWKSLRKSRRIIRDFKPDIAIGVGGYASFALLHEAQALGIPTLIQEQNCFAGKSNQKLGGKAGRICVAYEQMDRFFPADKIVLTGNPIRSDMVPATLALREEGLKFYEMDPARRHVLIVGGSLGSRTLNEAVLGWIESGCPGGKDVEILWQCGKFYKNEVDARMDALLRLGVDLRYIHHSAFIARMDLAYAMADLVISRSGASSISELCACGKPAVLVPSPNVTEDHQTVNARALEKAGAAVIVTDAQARERLMATALRLSADKKALERMGSQALGMALPGAAASIVDEIEKLIG